MQFKGYSKLKKSSIVKSIDESSRYINFKQKVDNRPHESIIKDAIAKNLKYLIKGSIPFAS